MRRNNKNKDEKDPLIDEILNEPVGDINEPIQRDEDESEVIEDKLPDPENDDPNPDSDDPLLDPETEAVEKKTPEDEKAIETPEQKDQRYKAQQSEAQIQAERNKALTDKVDEAANTTISDDEAKEYAAKDGLNWDELTNFEQIMAKKTYLADKKFSIVNESVQNAKKVDAWAGTIDEFIDSTDGKPEFIDLSSHEADFRKFALKEAHRGTPVNILLDAFLHQLPPKTKNRGSLFNGSSGGERAESKPQNGVITDAAQAKALREKDPRQFRRLSKEGKIKIDI